MTKEVWKPVDGFEDYFVSNQGRIKSTKYAVEKILKPIPTKTGYMEVNLMKNGYRKHFRVHRLVAKAFIPNPLEKPEINHIDYNRKNNAVWNLEWVNKSENNLHSSCHRHGPRRFKTNTGEHHIVLHKNHMYSVGVGPKENRKTYYFRDMLDAIKFRDKMIENVKTNGI